MVTALVATTLLAACSGAATPSIPRHSQLLDLPRPRSLHASRTSHIVVVVMENESYNSVIGNAEAPYLNALIRHAGLARRYYAIRHPSLPNYLAITGGSTFGVHSDCSDCHVAGRNIVDQLEGAGISWKAYMEDMPTPCYRGFWGPGHRYAKKHDPFAYYDDVMDDPARCRKVVPGSQLSVDLRRGALPTFAWVSPNQCNDMHDCGVAAGDRFLRRFVPPVRRELGPHGFLAIVWDEGGNDRCCRLAAGGNIPAFFVGPDVRSGDAWSRPVDHYSLLRTIDDALGLLPLGAASCPCTPTLDGLFTRRPRVRRSA